MNWAFMYDRAKVGQWNCIPDNTDVLITHGPPLGVLDQAAPHLNSERLGCYDLWTAVKRLQPQVHVFGHIHGGYGHCQGLTRNGLPATRFYNASIVNEAYKVANKPWVIELAEKKNEEAIIQSGASTSKVGTGG
jgi:hypothetical protein